MTAISRRNFVTAAAVGSAALAMGSAPEARAQLVYKKADWKIGEFEALARNPAHVKQVWDIIPVGEGKFLNNIKNSLNGLYFGFGISDSNIKLAAAMHGPANMLNYNDAMWAKYNLGAWLKVTDPATGQPAMKNPYYASKAGTDLKYASDDPDSPDSIYQDTSIQALQHRGVAFLSCHTALEEQTRALIKHNNLSAQPETIVHDLMTNALPGVLIVASMVAAIALLQTDGHYSYITVS